MKHFKEYSILPSVQLRGAVLCMAVCLASVGVRAQMFAFPTRDINVMKTAAAIQAHTLQDTLTLTNDRWSAMVANPTQFAQKVKYKSNQTLVKFFVDHAYPRVPDSAYLYRLVYQIHGCKSYADTTFNFTAIDTLTIGFQPDSLKAHQDIQIRLYNGLYKAQVRLVSLYAYPNADPAATPVAFSAGLTNARLNWSVELSMLYQLYDKTNYNPGSNMDFSLFSAYDSASQKLEVGWSPVTPPLTGNITPGHYQLEWTFADAYGPNGDTLAAANVKYNFEHNATRVETDSPGYAIPVVYPMGYLVYRVRIVRPDSTLYQYPVYGPWSGAVPGGAVSTLSSDHYHHNVSPFEKDALAWNYTLHIAEDGKYKHVVSFFDGLLKNRQALTRFNSKPTQAIVAEKIYDFEGRASINTLPAPFASTDLRYKRGVSLNALTNLPYRAIDFDSFQASVCPDNVVVPAFDTSALAARYYSPANSDTAGMQKFVPDAGGYPFTHVQYVPGYADRVKRSGGAGDKLQIGQGHETEFEYVGAEQTDLNRMLGVDAGWSNYYQKTVTTDPNGQNAMEITDYEGKKIASSLVGDAVNKASHAIVSNDEVPVTEMVRQDMLANTTQLIVGHQKKLNKSFYMDEDHNDTLLYEYSFSPYTVCPSPYVGLSVKAFYEYSVTNSCGVQKMYDSGTIGYTGVLTSTAIQPFPGSDTSAMLQKGKYTLDKTLEIRTDEIYAAVDSFFVHPDACVKTKDKFIREEVETRQFPCPGGPGSPCQTLKEEMMAELFPGAKYGMYTNTSGYITGVTPSIFDYVNLTGVGAPARYQDPCVADNLGPVSITVWDRIYTRLDTLRIDSFLMIYQAASLAQKQKIAAALLPLHPEYCKLAACYNDTFEVRLKSIPNAAIAKQNGMFDLDDLAAADPVPGLLAGIPYFIPDVEDSIKIMARWARLDTLVAEMAFCNCGDSILYKDCKTIYHDNITGLSFPDVKTEDIYWDKLRSLYLMNRRRWVETLKAVDSCDTCRSVRMDLKAPPLISTSYTSSGLPDFSSPSSLFALFTSSSSNPWPLLGSFLANMQDTVTDEDTIAMWQDSANAQYAIFEAALNNAAVDSLMARLANCYADSAQRAALRDTLFGFITAGTVRSGVFSPAQVREAILGAGLSLTDLCHPYLERYTYHPSTAGPGTLDCLPPQFYDAAALFLNRVDVRGALAAPSYGSGTSISLSTGDVFEAAIADSLNGATNPTLTIGYESSRKLYRLNLTAGVYKVSIALRSPSGAPGAPSSGFFQGADSVSFTGLRCFLEDPQAAAEGYMNRYVFLAKGIRGDNGISTTTINTADLAGWTNGTVAMAARGSNKLAQCVPCTQYRSLYRSFRDSMSSYGLYGADHPFYAMALQSFMNYSLKKTFGAGQYLRYLDGCALTDSVRVPIYVGYGRDTMTASQLAAFITAAAVDTMGADAMLHYKSGSSHIVLFDYNSVPFRKTRAFNSLLTGSPYYGQAASLLTSGPDSLAGLLLLPYGVAATTAVPAMTFHYTAMPCDSAEHNGYMQRYNLWHVYIAPGMTAAEVNDATARVRDTLYQQGIQGYWLPASLPTVNGDYRKAQKRELLGYTYAMGSLPAHKVLDSLAEPDITSNVASFAGNPVEWSDPVNPYRFTNLQYTDGPSALPGDVLLGAMLDSAAGASQKPLHLLASVDLDTVAGVSSSLILYRCANGVYWFRHFAANDHLYNFYLRIPKYVYESEHPELKLIGRRTLPGSPVSSRFRLLFARPSLSDTVEAEGWADFDLYTGETLQDALLGNETHYNAGNPPPPGDPYGSPNCEQSELFSAVYAGIVNYTHYIDSFRTTLRQNFYAHVMAGVEEKLWLSYTDRRFNLTLYGYDRAGNLVMTVPPEGIHKLSVATAQASVDSSRKANVWTNPSLLPQHKKVSRYYYDTRNMPVRQRTPDGGATETAYDSKGNAVFSRNDKQKAKNLFTYTLYDKQNRMTETGEVQWNNCTPAFTTPTPLYYWNGSNWIKNTSPSTCACEDPDDSLWVPCLPNITAMSNTDIATAVRSKPRTQVVYTVYDDTLINLGAKPGLSGQTNLRSRVAATAYYEQCGPGLPSKTAFTHATHYSYDASGNVATLTQDFPELQVANQQYKRVDYDYDLASGKVNLVSYNRGFADQYYQKYDYDADNRLTEVQTSREGIVWRRDAAYTYYDHGPLARMSLGELRVQGVDYAYTISGWLKAINGERIDTAADAGVDGTPNAIHSADAYATVIDYFSGDYTPIAHTPLATLPQTGKNLYNGNIARQTTDIRPFGALTAAYAYDQLNRIRNAGYAKDTAGPGAGFLAVPDYASSYKYDGDGNLRKLLRHTIGGAMMDSLTYLYAGASNAATNNNRLRSVLDSSAYNVAGTEDLTLYTNPTGDRFLYDATGNVIRDETSGTDTVLWNIYGKVTSLKNSGKSLQLSFGYDASGQRVRKLSTHTGTGSYTEDGQYYVRDATGNILAVYGAQRSYTETRITRVRSVREDGGIGLAVYTGGVLVPYYGSNGPFATAMQRLAGSNLVLLPTGRYLQADPALLQSYVSTGDAALLPHICRYSNGTGYGVTAPALLTYLEDLGAGYEGLAQAVIHNSDPVSRHHTLGRLIAADSNFMYSLSLDYYGYPATDTADLAAHLNTVGVMDGNPDPLGTAIGALAGSPTRRHEALNILAALTDDSVYYNGPEAAWYEGSGYRPLITEALGQRGNTADGADAEDAADTAFSKFADWWGAEGVALLGATTDTAVLQKVGYWEDPESFITSVVNVRGPEVLDTAMAEIDDLDPLLLAARVSWAGALSVSVNALEAASAQEVAVRMVLGSHRHYLAEHHIYGSARLGILGYMKGQFGSYWNGPLGISDTGMLSIRMPWYSGAYSELAGAGTVSPYGNGLLTSAYGQHTLGMKQYELTSHLGNVQATVSDKRHWTRKPNIALGGLSDSVYTYTPALPSAYDYYPFGQLMPGRWVTDTSSHCVTSTVTKYVPYSVYIPKHYIAEYGSILSGTVTTPTTGPGFAVRTIHPGEGAYTDLAGVPGDEPQRIELSTTYVSARVSYRVSVEQTLYNGSDSTVQELGAVQVNGAGNYSFPFTAKSGGGVKVKIVALNSGTATMETADLYWIKTEYSAQQVLVKVCSDSGDRYRFGFNGKEKDNEVAGIGNWQDYGLRMYNPRLARFPNVDPLTQQYPWYTPYQFAGNTPIWAIDLDGAEELKYSAAIENSVSGKPVIEMAHSTPDGKAFLETVEQNKKDVYYYLFDATESDHIGTGTHDAAGIDKNGDPFGTRGTTTEFKNMDDLNARMSGQGGYYLKEINPNDLKKSFDAGKSVVAIGIPRQIAKGVELAFSPSFKNYFGESFRKNLVAGVVHTIMHEEKAHAKNAVVGVVKSEVEEHKEYNGDDGYGSPDKAELRKDPKYKDTPAGKAYKQAQEVYQEWQKTKD